MDYARLCFFVHGMYSVFLNSRQEAVNHAAGQALTQPSALHAAYSSPIYVFIPMYTHSTYFALRPRPLPHIAAGRKQRITWQGRRWGRLFTIHPLIYPHFTLRISNSCVSFALRSQTPTVGPQAGSNVSCGRAGPGAIIRDSVRLSNPILCIQSCVYVRGRRQEAANHAAGQALGATIRVDGAAEAGGSLHGDSGTSRNRASSSGGKWWRPSSKQASADGVPVKCSEYLSDCLTACAPDFVEWRQVVAPFQDTCEC